MDFNLDLREIQAAENICDLLSDDECNHIGYTVYEGYKRDKASRAEWEKRYEDANKLALQVVEKKSFPWDGASNVKFPLLTVATLQFSARAYSALIREPEIVKCRVVGPDPDGGKRARANRVAQHLNYQVTEVDQDWSEEHDKLLMTVPIVGCSFIKSYYDKSRGVNVSQHVIPMDLVIDYYATSVEQADRKTHCFHLYDREIREKQLAGIYRDVELGHQPPEGDVADNRQGLTPPVGEPNAPRMLLEQHCWIDLDGDGYPEPYCAVVDKTSRKLLRLFHRFKQVVTEQGVQIQRIESDMRQARTSEELMALGERRMELLREPPTVLRIEPLEYFSKFTFIPAPDGGIYDLGFGALLGPINESVNTLINQLIDSGTLQNGSQGFIGHGARLPGGDLRFKPFEWKRVSATGQALRDNIVPLPINPPSPVLFQLLGLLVNYGERLASVTEMMVGDNPGQNTPAYNAQAMLNQGMAVFGGIFKRLYRGLRNEFRKLYILNSIYLSEMEYAMVLDQPVEVYRNDYQGDPTDVHPAADPNAVLSEEKMRQAQLLMQREQMKPGYDPVKIELRILEAFGISDVNEIYPIDESGQLVIQPPPSPDFEIQRAEEQRRTAESRVRAAVSQGELEIKSVVAGADVEYKQAQTIKTLAEAGAVDQKQLNETKKQAIEAFNAATERLKAIGAIRQQRDSGMDRESSNGGGG